MMTSSPAAPRCTVVVPSLNHGKFIEEALHSVLAQRTPVELVVMDGGSSDGTRAILERLAPRIAWWQSGRDGGQAAAINAGIARGSAPYVAWLNADDAYLPGGLDTMVAALDANPAAPAVYARALVVDRRGVAIGEYPTGPFDRERLARRCFISQPATLIRRPAWEAVGGVDARLQMAMDYDLWWKLSSLFGPLAFADQCVACTRSHADTKTMRQPLLHYREALAVIRRYYGRVPAYWYVKMLPSIGLRWAHRKLASHGQ